MTSDRFAESQGDLHGQSAVISHVLDNSASEQEWNSFERLAEERTTLWRDLAQAQRDHLALMEAMGDASRCAERIDISKLIATVAAPAQPPVLRLNRLGAWTGWAVAALVVIVASTQLSRNQSIPSGGGSLRSEVLPTSTPSLSASDA